MNLLEFIVARQDLILRLLGEHIRILFFALLFAIVIGVPIGILVTRLKGIKKPLMVIINGLQAVPSLALLGLLIPLTGVSETTAIILIVVYSILPIVKNTNAGIEGIAPQYIEAANGMGMTKTQLLTKIQLPLAFPIIMAGVRVAAVLGVGLVTIAAYAGGRGLGYLVYSGINTLDINMILVGALGAAILALVIDAILGFVERILTR